MAVKAKAEITISRIVDIEKVTRYYLLQSSTSATPSKPTANPPGGSWTTTEPAFGSDTTKTLYFVDLTVMTNGTFSYSAVSKSSSYEAAKEAWNKANNAQNTANDAKDKVDNLQVGGRNLALNTSDEYSILYRYFNGTPNICPSLAKVLLKGLNVGDIVTVRLVYKYTDLVPVDGQSACRIWIQGEGNVTHWNGGVFNGSPRMTISGSGEETVQYSFTIDDNHLKNVYWLTSIRHDYVQSGSVQWKEFKVEKGSIPTAWTPAPEDLENTVTDVLEQVNEIEHTAESNSARIETLTETVSTKADGTRVSSLEQTVNQVQQTADSNTATITQLDGKIATKADNSTVIEVTERVAKAEQNLTGFQTEVKNTYTTKTDFENLQVGGRNYAAISNSIDGKRIALYGQYDSYGDNMFRLSQKVPCNVGDIFTVSAIGSGTLSFGWFDSNNNILDRPTGYLVFTKDYVASFAAPDNTAYCAISWSKNLDNKIKLEKGNKATDWTPAPEDLIAEAATATDKKLNGYVTTNTYNSYVEQTDSKIAAKLESSEFTSFQDGEYTSFKKSTNEFIGTSEAWEMKWNKIFNGTDANEDTYQSYITFQNGEQILGNSKSTVKLHLKNDVIQFEDSNGNALASFDAENIYLGKNSKQSIIDLCNGSGKITGLSEEYDYKGIEISGPHRVGLFTDGVTVDSNCANKSSALLLEDEWIEMFLNDGSGGWSSKISLEGTTIKLLGDEIVALSPVIKVGLTEYREDRIELYGPWPYIDFHYGNSTTDYTSRIFENSSGNLWINGVDFRNNTVYCSNWFRSTGASGWYNETYGGGIWMADANDVRVFGGKNFLCDNEIYAAGTVSAGYWGNTGAERQVRAIAGAGTIYMYSQGNAGGNMGIYASGRCSVFYLNSGNQVVFDPIIVANGSARICGGGNAAQMSSSGNWISLNSNGSSGGHGSLGSGSNYWAGVYYTSLNKISDKRKKRDLGVLSLEESMIILQNTKTVKYSMLNDSDNMVQYGVFAQDVRDMLIDNNIGYRTMLNISLMDGSEQISTNLYESEDNVTYSVDYLQFVAPLIKGWQYHNSELDTLKREHQELQGKYNSLEGQIEALREKLHELEMAM